MRGPQRSLVQRLAEAWRAAPDRRTAVAWILEFAALRLWTLIIGCFPVETNLRTARLMGDIWWLLSKRHQQRALDNLRPSLGGQYSEQQLRRIARESFRHFAQVYLVEMVMTPRLVSLWSWARYVRLENLGPALRELLSDRGVIMVTAHFGNYELLGYTIARLGLPITAVMRPLDNPLVNEFVVWSRRAGGVELLDKKGASERADELLAAGGALCFIGDQDAGRKGVFADFFGRPASWYKSIGLLAMRHRVPIIVGYAARRRAGFDYTIAVERIIQPEQWESRDDPLHWITTAFAGALENAIRRYPEQYLWVHRRWKTQPGQRRRRHAGSAQGR